MSAVHANMSNTLNTPIEALEISYPMRVERYELRENSGGEGANRGGDGVIRSLRVIGHEARVSLQTDRRRFNPYGLHGGMVGATERNWIEKKGELTRAPSKGTMTLDAGDAVILETPGGGGWGAPTGRREPKE